MRTNYSGFALAVCMGLVVLLLGFLALSAGGLVQLGPPELVTQASTDTTQYVACGVVYTTSTKEMSDDDIAKLTGPDAANIQAGDALFKANCQQCHAVNEKVVGPALAGVTKRRSISWLIPWVHNSAKVIASGDEYANKLFNDYGKQQMPAFPQLSDTDIKNIMAFVSAQESGATASTTVAAN